MNVLILGGTGLIGSSVTHAVLEAGGNCSVLCRSTRACENAESLEAIPLLGDIGHPSDWLKGVDSFDAVIHCACTFEADMPEIDARLLSALFERMGYSKARKKLIYTGGTWLYPDSDGGNIDEQTPFDAVPGFQWMVDGIDRVARNTDLHGMTIHPAVVVNDPDGIPGILLEDLEQSNQLRIPFDLNLLWPVVHCDELADAYVCLLDKGRASNAYNAASLTGARVAGLVEKLGSKKGITAPAEVVSLEHWKQLHGDPAGYPRSQRLVSDRLLELGWRPQILQ